MARRLKLRQEDDSSRREDDDDNENNSTEDGGGSSDDSTRTTNSRTTSSPNNEGSPTPESTPTRTPASANASPTGNGTPTPTPTSIDSSDIISTKPGGQTVFVTRTAGGTTTITAGPQSANASPSSDKSALGGLSTGAKAGIALGVIIPLALLAGLLFFLYRKRRKARNPDDRSEAAEKPSEMASTSSVRHAASSGANDEPRTGGQASQTIGYVGAAELHSSDKAVETSGQPVYEMPGSSPHHEATLPPREVDAGPVSYQDVGAPPDYATLASPQDGTAHVADGFGGAPGQDIVSPMGGSSETYAPGDVIISPLDSKTRQ